VRPVEEQAESPFWFLRENPLYNYLIGIQELRIDLVELLAPRRYVGIHLWTVLVFVFLWLIERLIPVLQGFPSMVLLALGPILLIGAPFIAGWDAQLQAARNYISPLDSPQALEVLLCTPLSEREIVMATLAAHARYPFMGLTYARFLPVIVNAGILFLLIALDINEYKTLSMDVVMVVLVYYLPALCVLIYTPVITGIETLFIPSAWLRRREGGPSQRLGGRPTTGWLTISLVMLAIAYVILKDWKHNIPPALFPEWLILRACPLIIAATGLVIIVLALLLPGHLARLRRG
jgi:hypothetical protein